MITPLLRVIRFSCIDLVRNASLATMTVIVLSLLLISVNTVLGMRFLTREAVSSVKDKIDLSIYLKATTTNETINTLTERLKKIPEVKEIKTISREQSLENFKLAYADRPEIMSALGEINDNPLGATLIIKTDDPKDYEQVIAAINEPAFTDAVEDKSFADTRLTIDRITVITSRLEQFIWAISFVFGLIAIIIIYTTFRVAIYTERVEIAVKKLVGASNWFVRGPYIVEAVILSTISLVIALGTIWASAQALDPYFSPLLNQNQILTNYLSSHILGLAGFEYLATLALTIGTSSLAMRQYLKT